jgi:hypothetical protein
VADRAARKKLQDEALPIVDALRSGDLKPLGAYLKARVESGSWGEPVPIAPWLADELVAMIEGEPWCWFHLGVKSNKRGQTWDQDLQKDRARGRVGYFTEKRIRELGRGSFESAVQEACDRFGQKRTYVTDAHAGIRRYLEGAEALDVDGWQVLTEIYSAEID